MVFLCCVRALTKRPYNCGYHTKFINVRPFQTNIEKVEAKQGMHLMSDLFSNNVCVCVCHLMQANRCDKTKITHKHTVESGNEEVRWTGKHQTITHYLY